MVCQRRKEMKSGVSLSNRFFAVGLFFFLSFFRKSYRNWKTKKKYWRHRTFQFPEAYFSDYFSDSEIQKEIILELKCFPCKDNLWRRLLGCKSLEIRYSYPWNRTHIMRELQTASVIISQSMFTIMVAKTTGSMILKVSSVKLPSKRSCLYPQSSAALGLCWSEKFLFALGSV